MLWQHSTCAEYLLLKWTMLWTEHGGRYMAVPSDAMPHAELH